ncbi:MAG TPA: serine hydrolase domain-containing protein [Candidatus Eisenbacteria bacterium]|nr:serine hydrolase domain-containing protein [Candidatus Eisenbacteria bacterium]
MHAPAHESLLQPPLTATRGGFSRVRIARLQTTLRRHLEESRIPGLVALVWHRGREHVETLGTFAFEGGTPMRRDTIFRLASMTKPITAVAAMILVEECKIRLNDPVDKWLPELADRRVLRTIHSPLGDTVPATRRITVRDLLTFRSGYGEVEFIAPNSPLYAAMVEAGLPLSTWPFTASGDELMSRLGKLPLAHQPGERWLYHMGLEIAGVLIARVSGQSLASFLRERVFEPLGMDDTGFWVAEDKIHRLPTCYGTNFPRPELTVLDEARSGHYSRPPLFESGGGGLVSTVDDLLAFGRMMRNHGALGPVRILSRPSVELMTMDHITPEQKAASPFFEDFWSTRGWGIGMSVTTSRSDVAEDPGRFGWDGAFGTSWYVDPREDLVGVLMAQRRPDLLDTPAVTFDFWTSVYQLIDE